MLSKKKKSEETRHFDSLLIHGQVSDFMVSPVITLTKDAAIMDAKELMRKHRISGIPIVDDEGILIGLISIENIIIALEKHYIDDPIEKHMVTDVIYMHDDMGISNAMEYLRTYSFGRYPVVDRNKKVVGIVTNGDLMMYLYARLGSIYMHNKRREEVLMPSKRPVGSEIIMDHNYFSYNIDTTDLDEAGIGSTQFKKFLQEQGFPPQATRRASIALYEAEVNVVLHAGGRGYIKAYLTHDQLFMVVVDYGLGIDDIELAMQPGYTTAPDEVRERGFGAGMGLSNIKKYTDKLVILSSGAGVKMEMVVIVEDKSKPKEES